MSRASIVVLLLLNVALFARLAVYRLDQPWNGGHRPSDPPAFANPFRGGRSLRPSSYGARGRKLLPWLWIAQAGLIGAIVQFVVSQRGGR